MSTTSDTAGQHADRGDDMTALHRAKLRPEMEAPDPATNSDRGLNCWR
jgi:hypothetical protein